MDDRATLEIRETRDGAGVCLKVLGELDLATGPELRGRLVELRDKRVPVSIDLSQLRFMDSTGLALLIAAAKEADADGWRLNVLPDLPRQVAHLFNITGARAMILGEHTGHTGDASS